MNREELKKKLKERSRTSRERTDRLFQGELEQLAAATKADLDALRPQVTAKATYDKLIAEVAKATRRNESIAELRNRIESLGKVGVRVAKQVAGLLKAV